MRMFVESLKRLYLKEKVTSQKLTGLKTSGKITQEEYDYIKGA